MSRKDDFILTLDSDPEDAAPPPPKKAKKGKAKQLEPQAPQPLVDATLNPDFNFDLNGDIDDVWDPQGDGEQDTVTTGTKPKRITVDDIIERRKARALASGHKRKRDAGDEGSQADSESEMESAEDESELDGEDLSDDAGSENASEAGFGSDAELDFGDEGGDDGEEMEEDEPSNDDDSGSEVETKLPEVDEGSSSDEDEEESAASKERKAAFFAPDKPEDTSPDMKSFLNFNLSRPLLRAIQAMNFNTPTPIQKKAIPIAMQGLDVLGSAVTGSGKTAAFMIPILERLMFKDRSGGGEIRVLILTPTRELAVQCAEVGKSLARFMDITFAVIVGGLSQKVQESSLRARPDIVIATPGRLIDHIHNTPSFTLSALDILVLDEADRMLSDGFEAELTEIIQSCPKSRQTMLFSATMTDNVDSLIRLSMNRPVRLFVDPKKTLAKALTQEFVRVRKESDRQALLASLCRRTAKRATIIFFRSKVLCHQMKVLFGLLGFRASELHGNLTQEQRLQALKQFRDAEVDYLLATDVASRGLDIKGVETVINYDMPGQIELYLHRVGRTARASNRGRAISLVGEPDRKMLKAVMKRSDANKVKHRVIPPETIKTWADKVDGLKKEIAEVLEEEREEKLIRSGEMQIQKAQNMIEHKDEILARPKRTWFQSGADKEAGKEMSKEQYNAAFTDAKGAQAQKRKKEKFLNHQAKRRRVAIEEAQQNKGQASSIARDVRQLKKAQRPQKITWAAPEHKASAPRVSQQNSRKRAKVSKGGFEREFGVRGGGVSSAADREGARAKRGDNVPLRDKKGKGGSGGGGKGKMKGKGKAGGKGKRR